MMTNGKGDEWKCQPVLKQSAVGATNLGSGNVNVASKEPLHTVKRRKEQMIEAKQHKNLRVGEERAKHVSLI